MFKLKNLYFKSAVALTVFALSTTVSLAEDNEATSATGGGDMVAVAGTIKSQLDAIPGVIGAVSYAAGLAFGVAGVLKLKEYMDKPGQVNLKDPLGRLLVAALLVALPSLLSIMISSTTGTGGSITATAF